LQLVTAAVLKTNLTSITIKYQNPSRRVNNPDCCEQWDTWWPTRKVYRAVKPEHYFIWQFAFTLHPYRWGVTAGSAVTAAVPLCHESWSLRPSSISSSHHISKKVLELFFLRLEDKRHISQTRNSLHVEILLGFIS